MWLIDEIGDDSSIPIVTIIFKIIAFIIVSTFRLG